MLMGERMPSWLMPSKVTDLQLEPFVVARARMGGMAVQAARPMREKRAIGRRAGKAGSFSRWGWGQMGIKTRPPLNHLGWVAMEQFALYPCGLVRSMLIKLTKGRLRTGHVYQVLAPLERAGFITNGGDTTRFALYTATPEGLAALEKTRGIIAMEAVHVDS
jgi:hypothetical protein